MAEKYDFNVIQDKMTELGGAPDGATLQVTIQQIQSEGDAISELLLASRELAQPQPIFFTRG